MKKKAKLISFLFLLLISLSVWSIPALAEDSADFSEELPDEYTDFLESLPEDILELLPDGLFSSDSGSVGEAVGEVPAAVRGAVGGHHVPQEEAALTGLDVECVGPEAAVARVARLGDLALQQGFDICVVLPLQLLTKIHGRSPHIHK